MNRIKQLRDEMKISQNELATVIGVTQQAISSYENNLREPDLETLNKLADYFNVAPVWSDAWAAVNISITVAIIRTGLNNAIIRI